MAANDFGLDLDPREFPAVWFKGGSEPGVLNLAYLARTAEGKTYVVTVLATDPGTLIDETATRPALVSSIRGAFALLAAG